MKSWIIAIIALSAVGVATAYVITAYFQPRPLLLRGSMFVSDAGRSHGGFEYNAEWNATLTLQGSKGTLSLILNVGLGDSLTKHQYDVTEFRQDDRRITMKIDGKDVTLVSVAEDEIWGHLYDGYYIASWGGDAPPEEIRGAISPTMFPGLYDQYYVELRLR